MALMNQHKVSLIDGAIPLAVSGDDLAMRLRDARSNATGSSDARPAESTIEK